MFGGFDFALPAIFVTVCTISFGGLFAGFAWIVAFLDNSENRGLLKYPVALYAYSASILSVIIGMVVLTVIPYEWEQYHFIGARLRLCIYTIFLIISFVAVILCMILLRGKKGHVKGVLMIGSTIQIIVNVFGLLGYITMHGNP